MNVSIFQSSNGIKRKMALKNSRQILESDVCEFHNGFFKYLFLNEYRSDCCENWPKIAEYIQMLDRPFSFTKTNENTADTWRPDLFIEKH